MLAFAKKIGLVALAAVGVHARLRMEVTVDLSELDVNETKTSSVDSCASGSSSVPAGPASSLEATVDKDDKSDVNETNEAKLQSMRDYIVETLKLVGTSTAEQNEADIKTFTELADSTRDFFEVESKLVSGVKAQLKRKCDEFLRAQEVARVKFGEDALKKVDELINTQVLTLKKYQHLSINQLLN